MYQPLLYIFCLIPGISNILKRHLGEKRSVPPFLYNSSLSFPSLPSSLHANTFTLQIEDTIL